MAVAYAAREGASLPILGSTDLVITKPTGTASGDLLLCFILISANATITPPSGWTTEVNASGVKAYSKIAGGSEPSSYTFVRGTTTNTIVGQIARITGTHPTDAIDVLGAQASGSGTSIVLPSITVTNGFYLFQQAASLTNSTFTPPGTATEDYDFVPATEAFGVAAGHETVGVGATDTRTWTASVSGTRSGVHWALIAGAQTLEPGGIASTATFGSATVARGPVTISPSGIASTAAFGSPTVTVGPVTVSPSGIASTATFGTHAVLADQAIAPTGIASTTTFGSVTLTVGPVTLTPTGIASTVTFGAATVTRTLSIAGTARNHETGAVIAGATVKLFRDGDDVRIASTTSAVDGTYKFTRAEGDPSTYWVLVRGVGVQGVSEEGNAPT